MPSIFAGALLKCTVLAGAGPSTPPTALPGAQAVKHLLPAPARRLSAGPAHIRACLRHALCATTSAPKGRVWNDARTLGPTGGTKACCLRPAKSRGAHCSVCHTQTKPGLLPLWDCAAVASATPGGCDLRQHQRNSNSGAHNGRSAALRSPRARPLYVPRTSEMRRCFVWARRVPPCA
jgi:hypothetical protein